MTTNDTEFASGYYAVQAIIQKLGAAGIGAHAVVDLAEAVKVKIMPIGDSGVSTFFEVDWAMVDAHIEKSKPLDERTLLVLHERIEKQLQTQNDLQITHNAEYARGRKSGLHEARIIIRHELIRARKAQK